jgi:cytochrome oxidase Cu insertion factor (SCO1/SenC/PrrC family)
MTIRSYRWVTRAAMAAITIVAAQAAGAQGATTAALGPKDGAGMPPLDTGRVTVRTVAPDFTLEAKDGGLVTLSRFRGRKNVVLVFYRGHW